VHGERQGLPVHDGGVRAVVGGSLRITRLPVDIRLVLGIYSLLFLLFNQMKYAKF